MLSCWSPEDGDMAFLSAVPGCVGGVTGFTWTGKRSLLVTCFERHTRHCALNELTFHFSSGQRQPNTDVFPDKQ